MSCTEVINSLRLDGDPELEEIEDNLANVLQEEKHAKKQKIEADDMIERTSIGPRPLVL